MWAAANGGKALGAPLVMSKRAISVAGTGDAGKEGAERARPRRNCTKNAQSLNVAALSRKSHDVVRARKQRAAMLYLEQEAKGDSWSYAKVAGACDLAEAERYGVRYWVDLYRKDKELMSRIKIAAEAEKTKPPTAMDTTDATSEATTPIASDKPHAERFRLAYRDAGKRYLEYHRKVGEIIDVEGGKKTKLCVSELAAIEVGSGADKKTLPERADAKEWEDLHHALVDVPVRYLGYPKPATLDWDYERNRLDVIVGPSDFVEGAPLSSFGFDASGKNLIKLEHYLAKAFTSKNQWYAGFYDDDDNMPTFIPIKRAKKWLVANG